MRKKSIAAFALALSASLAAWAVTPGDFERAWNIKTSKDAPGYELPLPEDVVASTRQKWRDVAVLDASDRPMQFHVSQGYQPFSGTTPTWLKCSPTTTNPNAKASYRCVVEKPLPGATGAWLSFFHRGNPGNEPPAPRMPQGLGFGMGGAARPKPADAGSTGAPTSFHGSLVVRDRTGKTVATTPYSVEAQPSPMLTLPVTFDHAVDESEFSVEFPSSNVELRAVRLFAPPQASNPETLHWYKIRLTSAENGNTRFYYLNEHPARAYAARITLAQPLDPANSLTITVCRNPECHASDGDDETLGDILSMGSSNPSFPLRLTTFGTEQPRLRLESKRPLSAAPEMEVAWLTPELTFVANGVPPYILAVGQSNGDGHNDYAQMGENGMPPFLHPATGTLEAYSAPARAQSRLNDLAGPWLLTLAIAMGLGWALWPQARARNRFERP